MVGLAGLEPATFRPPDGRATRLRHSPLRGFLAVFAAGARGIAKNFPRYADLFSVEPAAEFRDAARHLIAGLWRDLRGLRQ